MQGRKEDCETMKDMSRWSYLCSYHKQYQQQKNFFLNLNLINKNAAAHLGTKHLESAVLVKSSPGLHSG